MKLWLDDIREPPDDTWTWVKTAPDCITKLVAHNGHIDEMSLDHDLGMDEETGEFTEDHGTGMDVLTFLEDRLMREHKIWLPVIPVIHIHTMNAAARPRMEMLRQRLYEICGRLRKEEV